MKKFKILKVVGLFLFLALTVMLLVGCEKDPVLDSTYIIKATSVGIGGTVSPSTIEVAKGENAAVALKPDSGYDVDVVKVDGNIKPVPTNLIYNFSGVVANHNMEVTFKKTLSWYLMNGEWKLDSISIHDLKSGVWSRYAVWGVLGLTQQTITFLPSGRIASYWDGKYVGNSPWYIDETINPPTFFIGFRGQEHLPGSWFSTIKKLDDTSFYISLDSVESLEDSTHKSNVNYFYSHHN